MGFNKYQKLKKQYSYNGSIWADVDPPEYKKGDVLEVDSPDCGYIEPIFRWKLLEDDFICENYNKYQKLIYQVSYDNGASYVNVVPEQTKKGELIEPNSMDCDYGITWELVEEEAICYKSGMFYERWSEIPNEYLCEGIDKYKKLIYQISLDNKTWYDSIPEQTKIGELIESNSTDCGGFGIRYKWEIVENEYICNGFDKYEKLIYKYSEDGGSTWYIVVPEQSKEGELLEKNSTDCGAPGEFDFLIRFSIYAGPRFRKRQADGSFTTDYFETDDDNKFFKAEDYRYGWSFSPYIGGPNNLYQTNIFEFRFNNFKTSSITDMSYMFYDCWGLKTNIIGIENWDVSNVVNMEHMFYGCSTITELNLRNWNTEKVEDMSSMFAEMDNLLKLDITNFNVSKLTDSASMSGMFYNTNKLNYIRCSYDFQVWAFKNQDIINLPETMRNGGSGTWEIVG